MKFRLIAATAAFAMFAGGAVAQQFTSQQTESMSSQVSETAADHPIVPNDQTADWDLGSVVPDSFEGTPFDMDGMDGYTYVQDDSNYYVMDEDRNIVHKAPYSPGSAGSQTITGADGKPVSQPTNQ